MLSTDGRIDKVNPVSLPTNFIGRGYNNTADTECDQWLPTTLFCYTLTMIWSIVIVTMVQMIC